MHNDLLYFGRIGAGGARNSGDENTCGRYDALHATPWLVVRSEPFDTHDNPGGPDTVSHTSTRGYAVNILRQ